MAYPSATDVTIANDALARLAERPIATFTDNSPAARAISRLYPRVRALMFSSGDWRFATARADLGTPATGVFPWAYEYPLPAGVARARMVVSSTNASLDGVGLGPVPYEEGFNPVAGYRVIWCDITPATLVYTYEIIDSSLWDAGFTACFTVQLAADIALPVTGNGQLAQAMQQGAARAIETQMPVGQAQAQTQMQRGPSQTMLARGGG